MQAFNDALKYLTEKDDVLKMCAQVADLEAFESTNNVIHDLVSCVVEQQIHYRSAKKLFERSLLKADIDYVTLNNIEHYTEVGLKDVKLSMQKLKTQTNIMEYFQQHEVNVNSYNTAEIEQHLRNIKGVGEWTVNMIQMFTLRLPNIFPADDYHLKQIMTNLYGLDASSRLKTQMKTIAKDWSPYQSTAVQLLWTYKNALKQQ